MISEYDRTNIYEILTGNQTWFGAELIRLIQHADTNNRELLRKGFPDYVQAFEDWDKKVGIYAGKHDGEKDD